MSAALARIAWKATRSSTNTFLFAKRAPLSVRFFATEDVKADNAADAGNSNGNGVDPTIELKKTISNLEEEVKNSKAKMTYAIADAENARRIAADDVKKAKEFGAQPFAKSIISGVDNLEAALANLDKEALSNNKAYNTLVEGLRSSHKLMLKGMEEHGCVAFAEVGDAFDYNKFNAVQTLPAPTPEAHNTVATVLRRGYSLKGRLIRPAEVVVYMKN